MDPLVQAIVIGLTSILFLILLDFVVAVGVYLYNGSFDSSKLLQFLKTKVAPYLLIWAALGAIPILLNYVKIDAGVISAFDGMIGIIWALIVGRLIADIYEKFRILGIEIKERNEQ